VPILEEHSESVAHGQKLPFGHGYDILSVDDYFARVRSDESNYQLKEYTFAAAASSDNHDPFALLDLEADASEHRLGTKALAKLPDLDHVPNNRFNASVRKKLLIRMVMAE